MTGRERQVRYAYLVTLLGVVLATVITAYTAVRSLLFGQAFGVRPSFNQGNFTRTQFGNFTGAHQFGNVNPYGGFANYVMLLAVIIAIVGVLWLGLSLRHEGENVSGKDKREVEWNYASILLVILGLGIALLAVGSYFAASHYIRTLAFMRMFPFHMHRFHSVQRLTNSTITNATLTNSTTTAHWRSFAMQHHHYFAVRRFRARIPFLFTIYQTLIAIAGLAVAAIGLSSMRKTERQ